MKVAVYSRDDNPSLKSLLEIIPQAGIEYSLNPESTRGYDIALSYGGDGTFLESVRKMGREIIPILGINSGRLGFLANVTRQEVSKVLGELSRGEYSVQHRLMLDIEGGFLKRKNIAVNEFTLQKFGTSMISVDIQIDGQSVANYWADGVIVSTPTGSTAYSMSVGGAILTPGCRCFIISPIAPHNLNIRPLVVPDRSKICITGRTRRDQQFIATVDNLEYHLDSGASFTMGASDRTLDIIQLTGSSFYQTLRNKLFWGIDARN